MTMTTVDHPIPERDIEAQEEFKEEAATAKELQPVAGMTEADLDISRLNQFIFYLNKPQQIETLKSDLDSARAFLTRQCFVKEGKVTVLGALVCGNHPGDRLGFRSHLHGYVDVPQQVAQDKQDFVDNVIQLMESGLGYLLRNIQIGIRAEGGGTAVPQYPEEVLRETVNNAIAHRDYSVNKQVILAIKPGEHIAIRNPGRFRLTSLIVDDKSPISIRRIVPEAKPRNPKLADVLRVYRRWEGRGIGMSTLVNLCLADRIDLPYYHIFNEEVCLYLRAGRLVGERMERLFQSFDRYFAERLNGASLTEEQKRVLAYLIKSEWANDKHSYTILLSPDNNHFDSLHDLERAGLIGKHPVSTETYPVYVADRVLVQSHFRRELRAMFGEAFDGLKAMSQEALGVVYRYNQFSKSRHVSAKQAAFYLWYDQGGADDNIREFDAFYRKVRYVFNRLEKDGFVTKENATRGYILRADFLKTHLL